MEMNSFTGKQVLALVRNADYAHAGEEEAIERALGPYPQRPQRLVLDVGCGRGGTARYIQEHGWGMVVGIDRDLNSIARARHVFPQVEFHACDVVDVGLVVPCKFDVICLFNSFYAFADQARALRALARLANGDGQLMLFDYTDRGGYDRAPLMNEGQPFLPHPLRLSAIETMLREGGWRLTSIEDLTADYERWYGDLLSWIDSKRPEITALAGSEGFDSVRKQYADLLAAIRQGTLGGAIVRAQRQL
jgi:SAM-dependent methyltransferase